MLRHEVWVRGATSEAWRFNACFDSAVDAVNEQAWYIAKGYQTDIRMRTTRYQQHQHITTG